MVVPACRHLESTKPGPPPQVSGGQKKVTILHFNDVYNIEPAARDPVGGASRCCYKVWTA